MTCTCGRSWNHCRNCGRKSLQYRKSRSKDRTIEIGRQVSVYFCQPCGAYTDEATECKADNINQPNPNFVKEIKQGKSISVDNRPQFVLKPGTEEYYEAFRIRFDELAGDPRKRGNLSAKDAMLKEGWVIEFESESLPVVVEQEEVKGTELTLEQVIEKMKEESK